jgi:hypothetical protein
LLCFTKEYKCKQPDLVQELNKQGKIILVTDGGTKDKLGSFGWVISTTTWKLWKGRGYAKGSPMDSHRAEGIG